MRYHPNFVRNVVPPQWVEDLLPGSYELKQIAVMTGLNTQSILKTLKKYGCVIKKVRACNNLFKNIVIWEGIQDQG